jgi:rhodanese-related sulfurtransferase
MEHLPEFITNHLMLVGALAVIVALLIWNLMKDSFSGIPQVSPMEMTRLINHEDAVIIDMRGAGEYNGGHVLSAINVPAADLIGRIRELEKFRGRPVVCYDSGGTLVKSIAALKVAGLDKLYNLRGGLNAWQSAGLPLSRTK